MSRCSSALATLASLSSTPSSKATAARRMPSWSIKRRRCATSASRAGGGEPFRRRPGHSPRKLFASISPPGPGWRRLRDAGRCPGQRSAARFVAGVVCAVIGAKCSRQLAGSRSPRTSTALRQHMRSLSASETSQATMRETWEGMERPQMSVPKTIRLGPQRAQRQVHEANDGFAAAHVQPDVVHLLPGGDAPLPVAAAVAAEELHLGVPPSQVEQPFGGGLEREVARPRTIRADLLEGVLQHRHVVRGAELHQRIVERVVAEGQAVHLEAGELVPLVDQAPLELGQRLSWCSRGASCSSRAAGRGSGAPGRRRTRCRRAGAPRATGLRARPDRDGAG